MKRIYKLNNLNLTPFLINRYGHKLANEIEIYYHYYITKILNTYSYYGRGSNRGYVPISSEKLDAILGTKTLPKRFKSTNRPRLLRVIKEDLVNLGVIKYYHSFYTSYGVKTAVMTKITKEYYSGGWTQASQSEIPYKLKPKQTEKKLKKIEENKRKKHGSSYEEKKDFHHEIEASFNNLTFDKDGAKIYLNNAKNNRIPLKPKKGNLNRKMDKVTADTWKMSIDNFDCRYLTVDFKSGRIFTNGVNIARELRQFIRTQKDQSMNESWDVSNCQPLLLCLGVENEMNDTSSLPTDYILYKSLCENGLFYKTFIELLKKDGHTVNEDLFKEEFFEYALFGKYSTKRKNKFRKTFENHFPTVSNYLEEIKKEERIKNCTNILARKLQTYEAKIMIEGVATNLIRNGIVDFYTIHDGIYTTKKSSKFVKQAIIDEFKKYNLSPDIKH